MTEVKLIIDNKVSFLDVTETSWFREGLKKRYGIFHTLVGWVGLKKSFSIKNKNKKHGLKMPKIA